MASATQVVLAAQDKLAVIERETWKMVQMLSLIEKCEFRGPESVTAATIHRRLMEVASEFEKRIPAHMRDAA